MADQAAPLPSAPDAPLETARQTLTNLLAKMKVSAEVTAHWGEIDETDGTRSIWVDVNGDDLSLLIGRKGETLAALQYLTRLLVAKELSHGLNLVIDVENFRQRRQEQLRRMARRTAEQVVQRQRAISLEPMPPDERRIIHLELRDHPDVRTESVGEGNRRKVTIVLK